MFAEHSPLLRSEDLFGFQAINIGQQFRVQPLGCGFPSSPKAQTKV